MLISIIAAVAKNGVIGAGGRMPWKIPGEQKRFRNLTLGQTVVMGRRTFEEIGEPLPGRHTVILSRNRDFDWPGCTTLSSWEQVWEKFADKKELFIAGGAALYRDTIPLAHRLYLTVIEREYQGDVYFPDWKKEDFKQVYSHRVEGKVPYTYYTYVRKE